jgi:hypothetical protein
MQSIEKQLLQILDSDQGEREVHNFLKRHRELVVMAFNRAWNFVTCVPEFKFGAEFRADFLILSAHSGHWYATFIELKDFKTKLYNKNGIPTKSFQQAKKQISDWSEWIRINEPYLRKRFSSILEKEKAPAVWPNQIENFTKGYKCGATEIADMASYVEFNYHVVIGRSSTLSPEERKLRQNDMSWGGPEVATYDRLLTMARREDTAKQQKV